MEPYARTRLLLGRDAMENIAWKYLKQLQMRAAGLGTQVQIPEQLAGELTARCKGRGGARQLRRLVQTEVEGPLASFLLRCSRRPGKLKLEIREGKVCFCS